MNNLLLALRQFALRGSRYFCPLCDAGYAKFLASGAPARSNARCPGCGSLERHRLLWVVLDQLWQRRVIGNAGRLLHVAPETCLGERLAGHYNCVSVDMFADNVRVKTDLTALCFPVASFDAVVCNHVLEHVADDRKALAELYRVLRDGGWGSIQVPMEKGATREDLSIIDPAEREQHYGQSDHLRQYGDDFRDRLRDTGFEVLEFRKEDLLDQAAKARLSVDCENSVILVRKPAGATAAAAQNAR